MLREIIGEKSVLHLRRCRRHKERIRLETNKATVGWRVLKILFLPEWLNIQYMNYYCLS